MVLQVNRYIYFCFAPTLVYRDEYPRIPGPINWIRAGVHALNLIGVISYTYVTAAHPAGNGNRVAIPHLA
jgi:hypothetical protein